MQPDPTTLMEIASISTPLIGFYDAPDANPFAPVVEPEAGKRVCVFSYYRQWLKGKTLHLTKEIYGCGGSGYWLCGNVTRSREDFVKFLVDGEGLKASRELMNRWINCPQCGETVHPDVCYIARYHVYTLTCPVCQEHLDEVAAPERFEDRPEIVRY